MSDQAPTDKTTATDREPTLADVMAIAQAAQASAEQAMNASKSSTDTDKDTRAAIDTKAQELNLTVPEEVKDDIATKVVTMLRGEFDVANPTTAAPASDSSQQTSSSPGEQSSDSASSGGATTDAATGDTPPERKPTFADKFLSGR